MEAVSISQIEEQLRRLPPEKLAVVLDFVSYLVERHPATKTTATRPILEAGLHHNQEKPEGQEEEWANL
jgi:hypothetical protein